MCCAVSTSAIDRPYSSVYSNRIFALDGLLEPHPRSASCGWGSARLETHFCGGVCISCSDGGRKGVGGPHESLRKFIHPYPHHVTPRDASFRSLYRCCTRGRQWSSSIQERWTLLCLATPSPSNQETTFTSNRLVDTLQYF